MSLIDFLLNRGVAVGCVVGIGAALLLHWLFPERDLSLVQALLLVFFAGVGMVWQLFAGNGGRNAGNK